MKSGEFDQGGVQLAGLELDHRVIGQAVDLERIVLQQGLQLLLGPAAAHHQRERSDGQRADPDSCDSA